MYIPSNKAMKRSFDQKEGVIVSISFLLQIGIMVTWSKIKPKEEYFPNHMFI